MFQTKNTQSPELYVKEWFIIFENKQEGPYSLLDLKRDHRFTPDTLIWKKGFQEWTPARFVSEIKEVFKDEPEGKAIHESENGKNVIEPDLGQQNQVTLTLQQDPYQLFLWILVLLLILFYTLYQFYYK